MYAANRISSRLTDWIATTTADWVPGVVARWLNSVSGKLFGMETTAKLGTVTERGGVIAAKQVMRRMYHEPRATRESLDAVEARRQVYPSGVERVSAEVGEGDADLCLAPADTVPEFRMVKDLVRQDRQEHGEVMVGASHHTLAHTLTAKDALIVSGCGWFSGDSIVYGDRNYLRPVPGADPETALHDFTRRTMVSLGAWVDDPVYSVDDFFTDIRSWENEGDYAGRVYFRQQEPHWIVTKQDGSFSVQSLTELRSRSDIAQIESVVPALAMVDESNAEQPDLNTHPVDLNAAIVFTDAAGKRRIGTLQGNLKGTSAELYQLAQRMAGAAGPVHDLQLMLFDGGRSRGSVVTTSEAGAPHVSRETVNGYAPEANSHELVECMVLRRGRP